jgi:hypothetical protein
MLQREVQVIHLPPIQNNRSNGGVFSGKVIAQTCQSLGGIFHLSPNLEREDVTQEIKVSAILWILK